MPAADGGDLPDVVVAMGEMEAAPLRHGERAEDEVGETASRAEGLPGAGDDLIELREGIVCLRGERITGQRRRRRWRRDLGGSLASAGDASQCDGDELGYAMHGGRPGEGWGSLGETGLEGGGGGAVGHQEMLGDLLDGPAGGVVVEAKLSLGGVEAAEGGGELAAELFEGGVHTRAQGPCGRARRVH